PSLPLRPRSTPPRRCASSSVGSSVVERWYSRSAPSSSPAVASAFPRFRCASASSGFLTRYRSSIGWACLSRRTTYTPPSVRPVPRIAEVPGLRERAPGGVVLPDRLVHPAQKELAVRIPRLLVGLVAVARDHLVGRLDDRPRDRLHLGQQRAGRRTAGRGHELLRRDRRLDVRDPILGDGVRQHVDGHAGGVDTLLAEQLLEECT